MLRQEDPKFEVSLGSETLSYKNNKQSQLEAEHVMQACSPRQWESEMGGLLEV